MQTTLAKKGAIFRDLHKAQGIFVMPNAWNAGSACLLDSVGFAAIGTTSAGIAFNRGLPDYAGALSRADALEETSRIAKAATVPVSADAENGYGHEPAEVAQTIKLFAATGVVGASIEDYSATYGNTLYERAHAVARISAAREAADALGFPFTLTARAECYLMGHPEPFKESVVRANLYYEAGADCLFIPGVKDAQTIGALVQEIEGPINVVMGLSGNLLSVDELEALGVKRVSIGGSLARTTLGLISQAAKEIKEEGTFTFCENQIPDNELCRFFSQRIDQADENQS